MMIVENQGMDNERTLDVEMGKDGHLELSCPAEDLYVYTPWADLPPARQEFFQVVVTAHARILDQFAEEISQASADLEVEQSRASNV